MSTNEQRYIQLKNAKACINAVNVFNLQENIKGDTRTNAGAYQRYVGFNDAFQKLSKEEKQYFVVLRMDALGPIQEHKTWSDEDNIEYLR